MVLVLVSSNKISKAHKTAFKNCSKIQKNGNGECFLFSENDKIVWELSEEKVSLNQVIIKLNKHDENTYWMASSISIC